MSQDDLGDRMKAYESTMAGQRLMPLLPALVRLDGRSFSKFTRGLARPYDPRMSELMVEVTRRLVDESCARAGYTQSDEISLLLHSESHKSQIYFDGRVQKIVGDLAAFTSLTFNELLPTYIPEKSESRPRFDCRVWNAPTPKEAVNAFLWRQNDASKNSVSMAARSVYSHKELQAKSGSQMQEMLFAKGINWNDYPSFFKRGTFVLRRKSSRRFTADELQTLPAGHEAHRNPDLEVERSVLETVDLPPLAKLGNAVDVLFEGAEPERRPS